MISAHGSPLARLGRRETGGMNVYVRDLSRALAALGVQIDVFVRRTDPAEPDVQDLAPSCRIITLEGGPVAEIDKHEVYHHLSELVCNIQRFAGAEGIGYDLIHSHYWLSGWVGAKLQQRWDVPHLVMFHTLAKIKERAYLGATEHPLRIGVENRILAAADLVVAGSPNERHQLIHWLGVHPQRIVTVPCGVDLERFHPLDRQAARQALGLSAEPVVLFVGRLDPIKGAPVLLDAIASVEEPLVPQLLIVGGEGRSDPEIRRLRAQARKLGIERQVHFLGPKDHSELPLLYNAADVVCVPSYYESFGLVALEAMACGTPVVASRVGGLTSTIRDGETGFLIPWRCPDPFAERLELLLGNAQLRQQFRLAAQQVARGYAWSSVAGQMLTVYQRLVGTAGLAVPASAAQ